MVVSIVTAGFVSPQPVAGTQVETNRAVAFSHRDLDIGIPWVRTMKNEDTNDRTSDNERVSGTRCQWITKKYGTGVLETTRIQRTRSKHKFRER